MRVLVTRPARQSQAIATRLQALGHEAILAPVTRVVARDFAWPDGEFDAIVATSARALEFSRENEQKCPRDTPFFCVGDRAAARAHAIGVANTRAPARDVAGLLALLARELPPRAKILYLAGRDRKPALESGLAALGHAVEVLVTYEAVAEKRLPPAAALALRSNAIDSILHFSRRGATILTRLADDAGLSENLRAVPHVCISTDAAAPLAALGARILVAATPDEDGVLAALAGVARPPPTC